MTMMAPQPLDVTPLSPTSDFSVYALLFRSSFPASVSVDMHAYRCFDNLLEFVFMAEFFPIFVHELASVCRD